jgi:deazaflavin-dependent oxidoreductase (nitroreductase family)
MPTPGFPEYVWGAEGSAVRKVVTKLVATRPAAFVARHCVPLDRFVLHRTGGRFTALGPIGMPMLVLTTTGRRTGRPRQQPLVFLRRGDQLIVVGTNFGQDQHPAWTSNILANPNVDVTIGGQTLPAVATQIHGEQQRELLNSFSEFGENYAAYVGRTERDIRVFALERT